MTDRGDSSTEALSGVFAASPRQRALGRARSGSPRAQYLFRVTGAGTREALLEAFEGVVRRHSALRTRLVDVEGTLAQVVTATPSIAWDEGQDGIVQAFVRVLGPGEHELRFSAAAAIVDVASATVLARELAESLAGVDLPGDPVQFVEFSDWRNEAPASAPERVGHERHPSPPAAHRRAVRKLDFELAEALARTAAALGVEPRDCLLAAWTAYVSRRTNAPVEPVHVPKDWRAFEPGLESLIGPATTYVPIPGPAPAGTFEERAVSASSVERSLREASDAGLPANGGVAFDVDPCPVTARARGVRIDVVAADACAEAPALRLTWAPASASVTVTAVDDGRPVPLADRAVDGVLALLGAALRAPRAPIEALPATGVAERAWLDARAQGAVPPAVDLLPARILAAARRWPDRPGVNDGTVAWSVAELVDRAERIATAIHSVTRPGAPVAIRAEPSAPTLAAMLGALLSGRPYVPISPALPERAVARLLDDSGASAWIAPRRGDALETGLPVVAMDDLTRAAFHPSEVVATDLAYVMYTSGSTGAPKGVMVTHGGLAHYADFAVAAYGFDQDTTGIVSSPFAFDLSVTTLLVPLLVGGATVIADPTPEAVLDALGRARGPVVLKVTPRHLDALASLLPIDAAGRVRSAVVGGEQLTTATVRRWRGRAPECRVFNEYGPTETVVGCCVHEVPRGASMDEDIVPIGHPITGASLHVLDAGGHVAPADAEGELYIGGAGVARGYLGAARLTAGRFVPDPFAGGGARMFRTGDRVRRARDGALLFVGRADDQLKVRGYRVEPGEVEAVLERHVSVRACAVVRSGQALVAFVVGTEGVVDAGGLARHAAEHLPEYMVPGRFVAIDHLPMTTNGKIDRATLSARTDARADDGVFASPRTEMERRVARVWCEVLRIERVDIDARFLEAGGDSLMIIEAARQLQDQVGKPVPPALFFEHPTVRALATALSGSGGEQAADAGRDRAARRAAARRRGSP